MNLGYLPIALAAIYMLFAIYAQTRLSELMDFINSDKDLRREVGGISDLYFIFDLPRLNYKFAFYLIRNKIPDERIKVKFKNYRELRVVGIIALSIHVAMGLSILAGMMVHVFFNHRI